MSRARAVAALLAMVMAGPLAAGDDGAWQRVPVTDGQARANLGVSAADLPDYAWRGPAQPTDAGIVPIARGQASVLTMGSQFTGINSGFSPRRTGFAEELYCAIGSAESRARARLPLPSDRRLLFLDLWGRDGAAGRDLQVQLFEYCLPLDQPAEGELTLVATATSSGSAGYFNQRLDLPPVWPATAACSWYLEVDFGTSCQGGDALRLGGVRMTWDQP